MLNTSDQRGDVNVTFEKDFTYELCFTTLNNPTGHMVLEFPRLKSNTISSKYDVNDGVTMLQQLAQEIESAEETVHETLSRLSVYDTVYNEMEETLYSSFLIKALVILVVCALQCWIFVSMVGKKAFEYKRVSIPI